MTRGPPIPHQGGLNGELMLASKSRGAPDHGAAYGSTGIRRKAGEGKARLRGRARLPRGGHHPQTITLYNRITCHFDPFDWSNSIPCGPKSLERTDRSPLRPKCACRPSKARMVLTELHSALGRDITARDHAAKGTNIGLQALHSGQDFLPSGKRRFCKISRG